MEPFTLSLLAGMVPYGIDAITGASKNRQNALNQQNQVMANMIAQLQGQIGGSVADSTSFKAGKGILDQAYKKTSDRNIQDAAASGASSEAKIGVTAATNEGYQSGMMGNLQSAEAVRNSLINNMNQLQMTKAGMNVQQADNAVKNQNDLNSGFMSVVPSLIDGFGKKKPKYDPNTGMKIQ